MDLNIKQFKPRRNSSNTLHSRAEEFVWFKRFTRTQATSEEYRKAIARFERWVDSEEVKIISTQTIYRYFIAIGRTGKGKVAIGQDRVLLSAFFSWCVRMGYMATNPVEGLPANSFPKPAVNHKVFTPDEYEILKRISIGTEWYYAIVCAWHTALRMSDVCLMKWEYIHWDPPHISLVPKKTKRTGKIAEIPIHPELLELLKMRSSIRLPDEQYVSEELAILYQRDRSATLATQFSKLLLKAGISGRTFHSLRHTALERWMNHLNSDVITVMDMSGHSSPKQLSRYCRPSIAKKRVIMGLDTPPEVKQLSEAT